MQPRQTRGIPTGPAGTVPYGSTTREIRPFGDIFGDFLGTPSSVAMCVAFCGIMGIVVPQTFLLAFVFVASLYVWWFATGQRHLTWPFRMPLELESIDRGDPLPDGSGFNRARGAFYLGDEQDTGHPVFCSLTDARKHMMVFGQTGSGKTEFLVSAASNFVSGGGGLVFADAKGDIQLSSQLLRIMQLSGREDDLLIVNYQLGGRDQKDSTERVSNTLNPFSRGTRDQLIGLITSLFPEAKGENEIFSQQSIAMLTGLINALVPLRDRGLVHLSARTMGKYLEFSNYYHLATDKRLDSEDRYSAWSYMKKLPGFKEELEAGQSEPARRQFGFAVMYMNRALTLFRDTYAHIFQRETGEIDFGDVISSRRAVVCMLPAMEKTKEEMSSLGKVVLASMKIAMSSGLGVKREGWAEQLIKDRPTLYACPFAIILDEYGAMAVPGFPVVATQARSSGFCAIFGTQDYNGLVSGTKKEEAETILANTNIHLFGRCIDKDTVNMLVDRAWKYLKPSVKTYETQKHGGSLLPGGNRPLDSGRVEIAQEERVDRLDVQAQTEGEFHMVTGDNLLRIRGYYANPNMKGLHVRFNRGIEVNLLSRKNEIDFLYALIRPVTREESAVAARPAAPAFAAGSTADGESGAQGGGTGGLGTGFRHVSAPGGGEREQDQQLLRLQSLMMAATATATGEGGGKSVAAPEPAPKPATRVDAFLAAQRIVVVESPDGKTAEHMSQQNALMQREAGRVPDTEQSHQLADELLQDIVGKMEGR